MKFINGTDKNVEVKVFRAPAMLGHIPIMTYGTVPLRSARDIEIPLLRGERCDLEIGFHPNANLLIYKSRSGGYIDNKMTMGFRDILGVPTDREILLTLNRYSPLIDLTAVKDEIATGISANRAGGGGNPSVSAGLEAGAAIIAALGTGIAALGPAGALPAGLVMGIGSLLLMFLGGPQNSGPPPLTERQVHDIVTEVVRRELKKNDAEAAAVLFASSTRALLLYDNEVKHQILDRHGQFSGHDVTPAERERFEDFVKSALREGTSNSLHYYINLIGGDPDRAKWILPAFLEGVGTYLTLRMLDILNLNARSGPPPEIRVSDYEATSFQSTVVFLKTALEDALAAFERMVTKRIEEFGVQGTHVEPEIRRLIRTSILGVPDLTAVEVGISELGKIVQTLQRNPGGAGLSIVAGH